MGSFEDEFRGEQSDMVYICLDYARCKVDRIYIYCFNGLDENGKRITMCDFFYMVNGRIVKGTEINDILSDDSSDFVSFDMEQPENAKILVGVQISLFQHVKTLEKISREYKKKLPVEIKLSYDVKSDSVKAEYEKQNGLRMPRFNYVRREAEWIEEIKKGY